MITINWVKEVESALDLLAGDGFDDLNTLLVNKKASKSEFLKLLSPAQYTLISYLVPLDSIDTSEYPEELRGLVIKLHKLAREKVPNILQHPAVLEIVKEEVESEETEDLQKEMDGDWNRIMQVGASYWYGGKPEALEIWTRLSFKGAKEKLLLETTASVSDVAFLAGNLTGHLKENLTQALVLLERNCLSREDIQNSIDVISELIADAKEIESLLGKLSEKLK